MNAEDYTKQNVILREKIADLNAQLNRVCEFFPAFEFSELDELIPRLKMENGFAKGLGLRCHALIVNIMGELEGSRSQNEPQ